MTPRLSLGLCRCWPCEPSLTIPNSTWLSLMLITMARYAYMEDLIGANFHHRRGRRFHHHHRGPRHLTADDDEEEGFYQYYCRVGQWPQ